MKKFHLTPIVFAAAFGLAASLNAATTTPVGAVSVSIPDGSQLISVPFQKPITYQGATSTVSGALLGLSSVPTLPSPAYVQVLSGTAVGKIGEVVSSTSSSVTMDAAIAGLAVGDTVAIRGHVTLADLALYINAQEGDLVTLYNPDGSVTIGEYYPLPDGWYDLINEVYVNDVPVRPGEGVALTANGARTGVYYGTVSANPVELPLPGSSVVSLVGTLDPVAGQDFSSMFPAATEGDLITVYVPNATTRGLDTTMLAEYYLPPDGWYDLIGEAYANDVTIPSTASVVYQGSATSVALHSAAF